MIAADIEHGVVSIETAQRDYGVVIKGGLLDQTLTAERRAAMKQNLDGDSPISGKLGFDLRGFDPVRKHWESVFDDAQMNRLVSALMQVPANQRASMRARLFEEIIPGIGVGGAQLLTADDFDIDAARTRLDLAISTTAARFPIRIRAQQAA